ncbi:MAG: hypothetical protein WCP35_18610 [Verrucomicrobiota bacterium]
MLNFDHPISQSAACLAADVRSMIEKTDGMFARSDNTDDKNGKVGRPWHVDQELVASNLIHRKSSL